MDRFDCRDAQRGGAEKSGANADALRQQSHERRIREAGFNRSDEREAKNGTLTDEKKAPYLNAVTRVRVRFAAAVAAIATSNDGPINARDYERSARAIVADSPDGSMPVRPYRAGTSRRAMMMRIEISFPRLAGRWRQ